MIYVTPEEAALRKAAEELVDLAFLDTLVGSRNKKVGDLVERFKKSHPDLDMSKLTPEHFTHWLHKFEGMDRKL